MKRMFAGLLFVALLLSALTAGAGSLEAIKEKGRLVVGTSPDYAPYEFPGPDGQPVGADISLARYIADSLGVELVIDAYDFDGVLAAVTTGKVDIALAGFDPTPERMESMDFSEVYYSESNQLVLIHKDHADTFSTLADLKGKKIAAQNGSVQETMVKEYLTDSQLELIAKVPDGVMMVLSKTADGMALSDVIAKQYMANYPDMLITLPEPFPYTSPGLAVAVTKGRPELLEAVNVAIREVVAQNLFYQWMEEAVELNAEMNQPD